MIHIDNRVGSRHLHPLLVARGLPCTLERMEYADIAFSGNGPTGLSSIGVELKRVDDLVGSLSTRRFQAHQLPGLLRNYEWPILIVEGEYRESGDGLIEKGTQFGSRMNWFRQRSSMTYQRLESTLMTLTFAAGFRVFKTRDQDHTAAEITRLYHWWQKPWEDHQSHKVGAKANPTEGQSLVDPWFQRDRYFTEAVALQVPGLGVKRALAVARYFRSVRYMSWSSAATWANIQYKNKKGKIVKIGPVLGKQAHEIFKREM